MIQEARFAFRSPSSSHCGLLGTILWSRPFSSHGLPPNTLSKLFSFGLHLLLSALQMTANYLPDWFHGKNLSISVSTCGLNAFIQVNARHSKNIHSVLGAFPDARDTVENCAFW